MGCREKRGIGATVGNQWVGWLGGMALGALAMYVADPEMGRRRRAVAQDRMRNLTSRTGEAVSGVVRDAGSRVSGLQAEASRLLGQQRVKPIDDHVLEARVRSRIGRLADQAEGIGIKARLGTVTLSGPVASTEKSRLLELVEDIPGVDSVRDRLHSREGGSAIGRVVAENLTPLKVAAGLGAGLLGYYALSRRNAGGMQGGMRGGMRLAAAGLGLLAGGLRNVDLRRLFGASVSSYPIEVEKEIHIKAAPDAVFDIWSRIENFPHFMSHVREVRDLGRGRSHWTVRGPVGSNIEWDALLTEMQRPRRMAWQSEPGALVENRGSVELEPLDGGTLVIVRMAYSPPAGALGQGVAMLLGSDPERQLEEDMLRMKHFIERGVPPQQELVQPTTTAGHILH